MRDDFRDVQRCSPWEMGFIRGPQGPADGQKHQGLPRASKQVLAAWAHPGAARTVGAAPDLGIGHLPACLGSWAGM